MAIEEELRNELRWKSTTETKTKDKEVQMM